MKTVAVIFGGRSTEHDISIITALASIIKPLELSGDFRVEPVYISRDGAWFWDPKLKDIQTYRTGGIDEFVSRLKPVSLLFDGGLTLVKSGGLSKRSQSITIDIVFPAMHGTYGEDGDLMGLLEMAGVPYVGCTVPASVIAMDKVLAKQQAEIHGIATPKFTYFPSLMVRNDLSGIAQNCREALKLPVFVKPAHLGSSIGISRATNDKELQDALEVAAHYDDKVLVEEAVDNLIEVTLPVMGNDQPQPALLERPLTQTEDFFDFDTKYMRGGKKGGGKQAGTKGSQGYSQIPADLPKHLYDRAVETGLEVYRALNCSGIARVDMLIDSKTEQIYFNEVNPMPGSLYAHNWKAAGISGVDLVKKLIEFAEDRAAQRKQTTTSFATSFLKQF